MTSPILICFALRDEAAPLLRQLQNRRTEKIQRSITPTLHHSTSVFRGQIAKTEIVIALTGIGPTAADRAARALLASLSPASVISAGFAGALRGDLKRGDIIIPELVTDEANKFACDSSLVPESSSRIVHRASLLISVPRIIATADEKRALHLRTGAAAVDMESASIGRVCREMKTPFLVARVISDEVTEDLPVDFNLLMGEDQQPNIAKAARFFLRHPGKLAATLKMRRQLGSHAKKLAAFLAEFLASY